MSPYNPITGKWDYYRGKQDRSLTFTGVADRRWTRWTEAEDRIILAAKGHGYLIGTAKQLGRTYASVRNRYYQLRREQGAS